MNNEQHLKLNNEAEMLGAILALDPFQSQRDQKQEQAKIEFDTFTQLTWLQDRTEPVLLPEEKALLDYWKDVGNKLVKKIKERVK